MKRKWWPNWLILAVISPLVTVSQQSRSCPTEDLSIAGGSFVLSNEYSHGSILRYTCLEGYYPNIWTRHCRDGHWYPRFTKESAECKKITCPNPNTFENGKVYPHKDRYYVSDVTTFSCHPGFTLRGSAERVCKSNGKWSGSTPICGHDSEHCPDPGLPPGSTRTGRMFNIDDKITYSCDKTLTLIGSKERVCQEEGYWSGTEPQCYADFTFDTPEEVTEAFSSFLKTTLEFHSQTEEAEPMGKKIVLDQRGHLDIYIAVDSSNSKNEAHFNAAKTVIKKLIEKISYYQVSPNYEILMFATEVTRIITMRNFKSLGSERQLSEMFKKLDDFKFDASICSAKGEKTGTNIAKAYAMILDSMGEEKTADPNAFFQTQHIVIMFTNGLANMGGNPRPKVEQIKHLVTQNNPARESKLDLLVFGVGTDVKKEIINDMVSKKDGQVHFFFLPNLENLSEAFDNTLDENTSVELCGIQQNDLSNRRSAFPWLAQIKVQRGGMQSQCMGSLVTSSFILTAAQCFRPDDKPEMLSIDLKKHLVVKAEKIIIHPSYNVTAKKHMGIQEYYEFDVALIQLTAAVHLDVEVRPICIPCTKGTNRALKLKDTEGTCKKHEEILMAPDLVDAYFTSKMNYIDNTPFAVRGITIKQRGQRDDCVEDAKKAFVRYLWDKTLNAKDIVTENVLCSGGMTATTVDNVACRGDSGGATYVNKNDRVIQVGVVSWGLQNICDKDNVLSGMHSRDYHTNLFGPKIRSFLKEHLGNDENGRPLTFLSD